MQAMLKVVLATLFCGSMAAQAADLSPVIVNTTSGRVQGVVSGNQSVDIYKGIPYAQPPIGALRWHAPVAVKPWQGVKQTTTFANSCYQSPSAEIPPWSMEFLNPSPRSEDCLYLNVWSPRSQTPQAKPVIVFIHGGAFVSGSGSVPIYDGENLAERGVVFITLNYRLGAFGFLSTSQLTQAEGTSGNYGIEDQILALKWIKANVAKFGGDPNNITIEGQSAGANSVLLLNSSPLTEGLFNKSVVESSSFAFDHGAGLAYETVLNAPFSNLTLAHKMKVTDAFLQQHELNMAQLRQLDSDAILKLFNPHQVPLVPGVDGKVFDKSLFEAFTTTHRHTGPIIVGYNQDELSGFTPLYRNSTPEDFRQYVTQNYPANAKAIFKLYPDNNRKQLSRDEGMLAMKQLTKALTHFNQNKVYSYYFNTSINWDKQQGYGAFHTAEVPFILDNLDKVNGPVTQTQQQVSRQFSQHLLQFAKTGDPRIPAHPWTAANGAPQWIHQINQHPDMSRGLSEEKEQALSLFGVK